MRLDNSIPDLEPRAIGKWEKLFYRITMIFLLLTGLMILTIFYFLFFPVDTTEFKSPAKIITPILTKGKDDKVIVLIDYCKHINEISHINISYVDDTITPNLSVIPSIQNTQNLPVGCHVAKLAVPLPFTILPDRYTLLFNISYQVNPIRMITKQFTTEEFEVLDEEPKEVVE